MTYRRKGIFERGSCLSATVLFMVVFAFWPGPARGVQQVTGESVTLAWDRSEGATGYMILYAPYPQGDPVERLDVGNRTEVTLDVWEGAAFYVAVQAYNENAASDLSDVLTFVVGGEKQSPIEPPDLSVSVAAGFDGLSPDDPVRVSVQLAPKDLEGTYRDTWITAETPFGLFSYVDRMGWVAGIHRYSQSPLSPIASLQVLDLALPPWKYAFHFAVDENWDNTPDGTWFKSAGLEITFTAPPSERP